MKVHTKHGASNLVSALALVIVVLAIAFGVTFAQITSRPLDTTTVWNTVTTTIQNTIRTTIVSTQTIQQTASSSSSSASKIVLSSIGFVIGESPVVYQRVAQEVSVPINSTITVTIVLNNTGTAPIVRAVNGTSISQATPQYWNFHVISGGQVINQSPPPAQAWYPRAYIPNGSKGIAPPNGAAIPNNGNTTLYLIILVPNSAYDGQLVISVF